MRCLRLPLYLALGVAFSACEGVAGDPPITTKPPAEVTPMEAESIRLARARYPRLFDLQVGLIETTCSPNPGVCHNSNNYPDLRTVGSLLSAVGAPCNIDLPDPLQGWDACERAGDVLRTRTFGTRIAWVTRIGPGTWRFGLEDAPMATVRETFQVYTSDGQVVLNPVPEWDVTIEMQAGSFEANVQVAPDQGFLLDFIDSVVATVIGGDSNRNGVFGADVATAEGEGALVAPGDLEMSYLWGRLAGTVPGTRMPLANDPLDNADYAAIACWIEGLQDNPDPGANDLIDYDGCAYAEDPLDPAVQ